MPSSVISTFHYDARHRRLRVEFVSGAIYDYLTVPPEVYQSMKNAVSKGTFLNREIKSHYRFVRIA